MTVYARIILYIVSGWLLSSGWINAELQAAMQSDPAFVDGAQLALGGVVAALSAAWWKLAKRYGWST